MAKGVGFVLNTFLFIPGGLLLVFVALSNRARVAAELLLAGIVFVFVGYANHAEFRQSIPFVPSRGYQRILMAANAVVAIVSLFFPFAHTDSGRSYGTWEVTWKSLLLACLFSPSALTIYCHRPVIVTRPPKRTRFDEM